MTAPTSSIHCVECRADVPFVKRSWRSGFTALAEHRRTEHPVPDPNVRRTA